MGEAPNKAASGPPIGGAVGRRLAAWCGLSPRAFAATFSRANVLACYPGPAGKGSAFPAAAAKVAAPRVVRRFVAGRTVVVLGKRAAAALGVAGGYFEAVAVRGATVVVVPHPSGVNRWYNEPANVARMRRFMRSVVEKEKKP